MSKDSDDEELLTDGKLICKKADMLDVLAHWGITAAVIKKVSRLDTKTDMPKYCPYELFTTWPSIPSSTIYHALGPTFGYIFRICTRLGCLKRNQWTVRR